jgi:hypothetical protein
MAGPHIYCTVASAITIAVKRAIILLRFDWLTGLI